MTGYKKVLEVLAALLLALAVGGIFFMVSGYNPFLVYWLIFKGAFGSVNSFLTTLTYATPLILSGLAFTVAKQANIMNLGGEGQIYVGAMTAAVVGTLFPQLPKVLYVPLVLVSAFLASGLYGGLGSGSGLLPVSKRIFGPFHGHCGERGIFPFVRPVYHPVSCEPGHMRNRL